MRDLRLLMYSNSWPLVKLWETGVISPKPLVVTHVRQFVIYYFYFVLIYFVQFLNLLDWERVRASKGHCFAFFKSKLIYCFQVFNLTTTTFYSNETLVKNRKRNWKKIINHNYVVCSFHITVCLLSLEVLNSGNFQIWSFCTFFFQK